MTTESTPRSAECETVDLQYAMHMIGNAHMDPVWVWDWREGFGEVWATFRSALDRINEHHDVIFTASSAAYYAWIERNDPAMFVEIQRAVASERWCLVGGMWIEPDCNIPSGESICRQLLLGQRYFERAFGRIARVGYNIDSFGHAAGLANLLVASGLRAYVMMRPAAHERSLPAHVFRWTDPSGRSIVTYRIPGNYETDSTAMLLEQFGEIAAIAQAEATAQMCFFGVGNHGGGPTQKMLEVVDDLRESHSQVRYSDPERYFAELVEKGELTLVEGELQHHAVGCYSASAWVKAANREAETALLDAEVFEAVASKIVGRPASNTELGRAWEQLALCQFHDVLAGTSSEQAYKTIRSRFGYVTTIGDDVTTNALYEVAHCLDTRVEGIGLRERESLWTTNQDSAAPFVVYNPLAWPVRQVVKAPRSASRVLDSTGQEVASQAVSSGELTVYPSHTIFSAELEPLGYEVYWLQGGRLHLPDATPRSTPKIERGRFRAEVDEATGAIASLFDHDSATELVGPGGIRPIVLVDESDTWSHGLSRYEGVELPLEFEGWEVVEDGPLRSQLRLRFRSGASQLIEDVTLVESAPFAELRLRAQWATPKCVVKLVLPWRLGPIVATVAGAAYSYQEREATGDEEVMQGWLDCCDDVTNRGIGLTVDHLYGYDASEGTVRLTLLRNPLAADHGGKWAARVGEDFPLADSGRHEASVRIHPHAGDWRAAGLAVRVDEHRRPAVVIAETYHEGSLPGRGAFLRVDPHELAVVRAVKRAENGEGLVLRLVESVGRAVSFTLTGELLGRSVPATLAPYEVQTLLVPDDVDAPPRVVDVTEFDPPQTGMTG